MPTYRVRVWIDLAGIRARFARERPPVRDEDWDDRAYLDDRIAACREALGRVRKAEPGLQLEASFDTDAWRGDRVLVSPAVAGDDEPPARVVRAVEQALRPVFAEAGAWRRHLGAAWFERHRAWRREAGSPIAH